MPDEDVPPEIPADEFPAYPAEEPLEIGLADLAALYADDVPQRLVHLEDEPSTLVSRYLFPTEKFRGEWRRHGISLLKDLLAIAALAYLFFRVQMVDTAPGDWNRPAGITGAAATAVMSLSFAHWWYGRLVLTNKRLMLVEGAFFRRVSMMPLVRVTGVQYTQSPLGRVLNYGTFVNPEARWRQPMRRIINVPHPNELYLRIVEELYEPEAVEARLGARVEQSVHTAVREVLYGPTMVNYDGYLSVAIYDEHDRELDVSPDRRITLRPGRTYSIVVTIGPAPDAPLAEPLVVTDGVSLDTVPFAIELDSDRWSLRHPAVDVEIEGDSPVRRSFPVMLDTADGLAPWLWVRVSQQRRTVQSVELQVDAAERNRD